MSAIRPFAMPKWGIEMTEGLLAEWKVGEGQPFARGDVIALIETDKITNDVEAEFDGVLARALAETGETYPVGALLGVFATTEASAAEVEAFIAAYRPGGATEQVEGDATPADAAPEAPAPLVPPDLAVSPAARAFAEQNGMAVAGLNGSGRGGRLTLQDVVQASRPEPSTREVGAVDIRPTGAALDAAYASPLAKRLAVKHEVALGGVAGTGPRGRIRKDDVLAAVAARTPPAPPAPPAVEIAPPRVAPPVGQDVEVIRMTPMRKAIARRLTQSKTTIPHFYLRAEPQADTLLAFRGALNAEGQGKVTLNDLIVRVCAMALRRSPDVNVQVHGEEIHRFRHADIAVAVSTERGLLTPVVTAADTKDVRTIGAEIRALAERARSGRLRPEEFDGGTFSVSNLGMYGVSGFEAVINPPQGAILAIGALQRRMVERAGGFGFVNVMPLSLSCDHRAIDGAVGARFLQVLCELLQEPSRLLSDA